MKFFSSIYKGMQIDRYKYYIPKKVIMDTESVLVNFPLKNNPNEMMVFWAGIKEKNKIIVNLVV